MQRHTPDERESSSHEAIHWYLEDLEHLPVLSRQDEQALLQQIIHNPDGASAQQARMRLVEASLPLVVKIATRYQGWGLALADLIQEGNLAVVNAVQQFNPGRIAHVRDVIRRRIHRRLFNVVKTHLTEQYLAREETGDGASNFPFPLPARSNVNCRRLHVNMQHLDVTHRRFLLMSSLGDELPAEEDNDERTGGRAPQLRCDEADTPEGRLCAEEQQQALLTCLRTLRLREQQVLIHYYLIDEPLTLAEIGKVLGVTLERVRQIKEHALRRLRHPRYWNLLWGTE